MDESESPIEVISAELPEGIPSTEVFSVLGDPYCQRLLVLLQQLDAPEQLSAVTLNLAAESERDNTRGAKEVEILLYHVYIPKLEEAGFISFDEEQRTLELTERGETVVTALPQPS